MAPDWSARGRRRGAIVALGGWVGLLAGCTNRLHEWNTAVQFDDPVPASTDSKQAALFKAAVFGKDPNWGRVLSALGTTDAAFDPDAVDVSINGVQVCRSGAPGEDRARVDLTGRHVDIDVDLHAGDASWYVLTNDLSLAYVHENSAYST